MTVQIGPLSVAIDDGILRQRFDAAWRRLPPL
jgi:hypothetical protein